MRSPFWALLRAKVSTIWVVASAVSECSSVSAKEGESEIIMILSLHRVKAPLGYASGPQRGQGLVPVSGLEQSGDVVADRPPLRLGDEQAVEVRQEGLPGPGAGWQTLLLPDHWPLKLISLSSKP
jgi:hypothetical protein